MNQYSTPYLINLHCLPIWTIGLAVSTNQVVIPGRLVVNVLVTWRGCWSQRASRWSFPMSHDKVDSCLTTVFDTRVAASLHAAARYAEMAGGGVKRKSPAPPSRVWGTLRTLWQEKHLIIFKAEYTLLVASVLWFLEIGINIWVIQKVACK